LRVLALTLDGDVTRLAVAYGIMARLEFYPPARFAATCDVASAHLLLSRCSGTSCRRSRRSSAPIASAKCSAKGLCQPQLRFLLLIAAIKSLTTLALGGLFGFETFPLGRYASKMRFMACTPSSYAVGSSIHPVSSSLPASGSDLVQY